MFVTVRANLRIVAVFVFSQSNSVYISSTPVPNCLFVRYWDIRSFSFIRVLTVGRLEAFDIIPERLGSVPDKALGLREAVAIGL